MPQVLAVLVTLAILSAQFFYGGMWRPIFAVPAYAFIALAACGALFLRPSQRASLAASLSVAALAAWLFWNEAHSPDQLLAGSYFRLTLACLLCYFLFSQVLVSPSGRVRFVAFLLVAAMLHVIVGAWQYTRPDAGMPLPWMSEQLRVWFEKRMSGRAHGFYLSGNSLVWFLNINVLFALSLACWGRLPIWARLLFLYGAGVSLTGAVMCVSRGGLWALAGGMLVFLGLSACLMMGARGRRWPTLLGGFFAIGLVLGAGLLLYSQSSKAQSRFEGLTDDSYRSMIWNVAARQAQLDPLHGTGAGTFIYYARQLRNQGLMGDDVFAHNDWLQLTTDFGFPALALLLVVVSVHFCEGLTGLRRAFQTRMATASSPRSNSVAIKLGALAGVTVCVIHSCFDFNMQVPANALLASACLGMLAGCGESEGRASFHLAMRVMLLLGGMVLFLALFWSARPDWFWLRAENALLRGDTVQAKEWAAEGLLLAPRHHKLSHLLAEALLQEAGAAGDPATRRQLARSSLAAIDEAIASCPMDTTLYILRSNAAIVADQPEDLLRAAGELIHRSPFNPLGYEFQGLFLEDQADPVLAFRFYRIAYSLPETVLAQRRMKALNELSKLRPKDPR